MNDYNRESSIVFLMGNLTWSYGWCSTPQRVHCGLEYWWRRMSLRITDLQNPIWSSLHLVFVLSYIVYMHSGARCLIYFHNSYGFIYLISSTRYHSCTLWWVGNVGTFITWLYGCWLKKKQQPNNSKLDKVNLTSRPTSEAYCWILQFSQRVKLVVNLFKALKVKF